MNLEDITKILGKAGKVVIVENGKPSYVLISFEEYTREEEARSEEHEDFLPPIMEEDSRGEEEESAEELTIDDLPV